MNLQVSGKIILCKTIHLWIALDCKLRNYESVGTPHAGGQTGKAGVAALVGLTALIPGGSVVVTQWAQRGSLLEPREKLSRGNCNNHSGARA